MSEQTAKKAASQGLTVADARLLADMIAENAAGKKKEFKNVDVGVKKEGTKIILPEQMSSEEAIECLKRKIQEEQTTVSIYEEVVAYPLDGAYALMEVLKEKFGWAQAVPTPGFFGDDPPAMVTLEIGYEKWTQVIWGGFAVPGVDGRLQTGVGKVNGRPIFVIGGEVKQKHKPAVQEIADRVRAWVKSNSIYKGKAIRMKGKPTGDFDEASAPRFLDLSRVNPEELTFSEETARQVQTNLFTPIERTAQCREHGVPLKRGVLLEGPYGTGKTLTAYVTAKKCEDNGWTFIYLDNVLALKDAMLFARQYAPAVVFAEDIDRVVTGDRSTKIDDILNNIDGVDSKHQELIVILTTNYVEKIEKAMMRPGRLDAVISVTTPDARAAEKLVRLYSHGRVPKEEDLAEVGKELAGQIPAVIREVVERSKLYAISALEPGETLLLKGPAIVGAAKEMKRHIELMQPPKAPEMSTNEKLGAAFQDVMQAKMAGTMEKVHKTDSNIRQLAKNFGSNYVNGMLS